MIYNLHTTKKTERDALLQTEGEAITIDPASFHYGPPKPLIWEEDTGKFIDHSPDEFLELLRAVDENPNYDYHESAYWKANLYKAKEVQTRLQRLPALLADIKANGIKEPVHCEITGERIDGAYRTKIALYLGIKEVPAIRHRFKWQDIDDDFVSRKLRSRELSAGKDYYEFYYSDSFKNIMQGGEVYRENAAPRWEVLKDIIDKNSKSVLDIGCNEGYISLQCARGGLKVEGIDLEWNHIAYLNKLVYEYVDKKDYDVEFFEEDLLNTKRTADTILMLNVLYHVPKAKQEAFINKFKGKQIIFQCNLRKEAEREKYYTSHPDDLKELLQRCGRSAFMIDWRDKPIIIAPCVGKM